MLTNTGVKKLKAAEKPYKKTDALGLYLLVKTDGSKHWRFKYYFDGKEKLISLGVYPDVGLAKARSDRDEARRLVANGIDPSELRKQKKAARVKAKQNTFERIALEWFLTQEKVWSKGHAKTVIDRLKQNVFPFIGAKPIKEITTKMLLSVIRKIEERGALEVAHRTLSICSQIFRHAVAEGRAERDIAVDLRGALKPRKTKHFAAVISPQELAGILRAFDSYRGTPQVRSALRLTPMLFVRYGELRRAKWADFDLEKAEWRYLVTKTDRPHIVPLSRQAVSILKELCPLTGHNEYVFSGIRDNKRPMSENTLLAALSKMDISNEDTTIHGFRATARTLLAEELGFRSEIIELQLAHTVKGPLGDAYNRTTFLEERRHMMQAWSDYLDKIKATY